MPASDLDAMKIRRQWMREMGYSKDAIAFQSKPKKFPAKLEDELENLEAARRLGKHGIRDVLKRIGVKIDTVD